MLARFHLRCRVVKKHRWERRRAAGDEEYWECRDCGAAFSGAAPTGESRFRFPTPIVGLYRDKR